MRTAELAALKAGVVRVERSYLTSVETGKGLQAGRGVQYSKALEPDSAPASKGTWMLHSTTNRQHCMRIRVHALVLSVYCVADWSLIEAPCASSS